MEKYIFQKINTNIFKNTEGMMNNIDIVTTHIREKAAKSGRDPERATLHFLPASNNTLLYKNENGAYRVSKYIANTVQVIIPAKESLKNGLFKTG